MMKRDFRICVAALALLAGFAGGCMSTWMYPHAGMEGLADSSDVHRQRVQSIVDHDNRALADDLDQFYMTDRPSRLTRWHSR